MKKPDWMLDFRYPLNCPDNVLDGVFTEHTIGHFYPNHAYSLLMELYITMKDGTMIRITVPDLEKYIGFYTKDFQNISQLDFPYKSGAEAIRNLTRNFLHHSVWDTELLNEIMKEIGFRDIQERKFKECKNIFLLVETEERKWETLYMEGVKRNDI